MSCTTSVEQKLGIHINPMAEASGTVTCSFLEFSRAYLIDVIVEIWLFLKAN